MKVSEVSGWKAFIHRSGMRVRLWVNTWYVMFTYLAMCWNNTNIYSLNHIEHAAHYSFIIPQRRWLLSNHSSLSQLLLECIHFIVWVVWHLLVRRDGSATKMNSVMNLQNHRGAGWESRAERGGGVWDGSGDVGARNVAHLLRACQKIGQWWETPSLSQPPSPAPYVTCARDVYLYNRCSRCPAYTARWSWNWPMVSAPPPPPHHNKLPSIPPI